MVREQSTAVKCPFSDAYYFDYNDLVHGSCSPRALSYAKPCSGYTKYQLRFTHCDTTAMFHGKDLDLECLATWKDGSETFLYGRLSGHGLLDKEERYRCFKYQHYGSDLQLAMSADTTCRGLRSATDGPFLMEFSRDSAGWPSPSCQYPEWLRSVTWRDIDDQWRFTVDDTAQTLHMTSQMVSTMASSGKQRGTITNDVNEYRCRQMDTSGGSDTVVIHSFTIQNCITKYQCIKFRRLSSQAVELRYGTLSDHDSFSRCVLDVYKNVQILIPADGALSLSPCPRSAVYHTLPTDGCLHRLTVGCQNQSVIVINHSCSPNSAGMSLECLTSWNNSANTTSYIIVRQQQTNFIECFSYRLEGGKAVFGTDVSCSGNMTTSRRRDNLLNYSITRSDNCRNNAVQRQPATSINSPPTAASIVTMATTSRSGHIQGNGVKSTKGPKKITTNRFSSKPTTPLPTNRLQQQHPDEEYDEDYDSDDDDIIDSTGSTDRNHRPDFVNTDDSESSGDENVWQQRLPATSPETARSKHVRGDPSSSLFSNFDEYVDESEIEPPLRAHNDQSGRTPHKQNSEVRRPQGVTEANQRRYTITSIRTASADAASLSRSWTCCLALLLQLFLIPFV